MNFRNHFQALFRNEPDPYSLWSQTTEPQINVSGVNGIENFKIGFKEKNFLGLGKTLQYFYIKENGVYKNQFAYTDPQLLGSRWRLEAVDVEASNGHERGAKIDD